MKPDRFVHTSRGDFAVVETGPVDGPRVLCLHGFPDTPAGMRPLADALAERGYRSVAPWLRGYWPSPLDGPFHVEALAADVLAIDDALDAEAQRRGPTPALDSDSNAALNPALSVTVGRVRESLSSAAKYLIGHDWGAVVGWQLLSSERRFRHVALLAVPHPVAFLSNTARSPGQLVRSRYMGFFQLGPLADRLVARDDFAYVERLWRRWSPGFEPGAAYWAHLRETFARSHPAPLDYYRAIAWPPREAVSRIRVAARKRITIPVLQLMGARDGCITPDIADGQARFCEALRAEVLDEVGHFLHFEAPARIAVRIDEAFSARSK